MFDLTQLHDVARHEGRLSRRLFLAYGAALASVLRLGTGAFAAIQRLHGNPFSLGVASGEPDHTGFVLWTRLAPEPLVPAGGMPPAGVDVQWQIAEDDGMKKVVRAGKTVASPQLGHSVHVEVTGLKPDRWYWYQFRAAGVESPIGRARTLPHPSTMPDRLRFAVTSCQSYEQGLFTGYEQMARDDVDFVVHLGDYIYEYAAKEGQIRQHFGGEIESLADYRIRHAQYRSDALLQGMHANCPWFVTWDDHELDNNCAADISEEADVDPLHFLLRRANAYQAYYEMMPLRRRSLPRGHNMRMYRRAAFGRLAELILLDTRQYRSDQPNGDVRSPLNEAAFDTRQTMLGANQRNWLYRSLLASKAEWNVLAQQVMMGAVGFVVDGEGPLYWMDQWPGYAAERAKLLRFLADRRVPNPVVLTGDIHSNWANELRVDDRQADTPVVASEFVATSLSSGGNGIAEPEGLATLLSNNPCVRFHNQERGYIVADVTRDLWVSDYMVINDVLKPGGTTSRRARFVVESGSPTVKAS